MHPGVSGRKHLPRFRDWPPKSRTEIQEPRSQTLRTPSYKYSEPIQKYERPHAVNRNQEYFNRYGNAPDQQRSEDDYSQQTHPADNYGGQGYYGRSQIDTGKRGFRRKSMLDGRHVVRKRNAGGEDMNGVLEERARRKGRQRNRQDVDAPGAGTLQKVISTGKELTKLPPQINQIFDDLKPVQSIVKLL